MREVHRGGLVLQVRQGAASLIGTLAERHNLGLRLLADPRREDLAKVNGSSLGSHVVNTGGGWVHDEFGGRQRSGHVRPAGLGVRPNGWQGGTAWHALHPAGGRPGGLCVLA